LLTRLNRLLQIFTRRAMDQKHPRSSTSLALANQAAVEPHMVRRSHSNAKYGRLAINGNSSCANPVLDLAARCQTGS
jgi:hypothetical protein